MRKGLSLRERAGQRTETPTMPDYADGRPFNPVTPHLDGYPRVMVTQIPMRHAETGEVIMVYEVDYFNCTTADAAALYETGKAVIAKMVADAQ